MGETHRATRLHPGLPIHLHGQQLVSPATPPKPEDTVSLGAGEQASFPPGKEKREGFICPTSGSPWLSWGNLLKIEFPTSGTSLGRVGVERKDPHFNKHYRYFCGLGSQIPPWETLLCPSHWTFSAQLSARGPAVRTQSLLLSGKAWSLCWVSCCLLPMRQSCHAAPGTAHVWASLAWH
jgi:hypothetical protein